MADKSLGELWLRGKIEHHTRETFHRADPQLVYAALKDIFRTLDKLRGR